MFKLLLFVLIWLLLRLVEPSNAGGRVIMNGAKPDPPTYYVRVGRSLKEYNVFTEKELLEIIERYGDFCGGVFISPTVIVTSAWCFYWDYPNRWAFNETEIFAYFGRSLWYSWIHPIDITLLQVDYYVVHPLYDPVAVANGAVSMNDIAYVVLKDKPDSQHAYLRPCDAEEKGGYGYETAFSFTIMKNDLEGMYLAQEELTRYADGKYCPGAPGMDYNKQVCYNGDRSRWLYAFKAWFRNGDPLVHSNDDEPQCLLGIGIKGFDGNFLFTRADWAFDCISSKFGTKLLNTREDMNTPKPLSHKFSSPAQQKQG